MLDGGTITPRSEDYCLRDKNFTECHRAAVEPFHPSDDFEVEKKRELLRPRFHLALCEVLGVGNILTRYSGGPSQRIGQTRRKPNDRLPLTHLGCGAIACLLDRAAPLTTHKAGFRECEENSWILTMSCVTH